MVDPHIRINHLSLPKNYVDRAPKKKQGWTFTEHLIKDDSSVNIIYSNCRAKLHEARRAAREIPLNCVGIYAVYI